MKIISEMYSPSNESQFVSYAVDFLLDASSLVSDYESNIFDSPLLSTDEFQVLCSQTIYHFISHEAREEPYLAYSLFDSTLCSTKNITLWRKNILSDSL